MEQWKGAYVAHLCRFCGDIFVAEDYTKATTIPPKWRACKKCCEEKGIDYAMQKPDMYRTPEQLQKIKEKAEKFKERIKKAKMNNK